ncbi:cysteine--tRNA ligase [Desulfuribacillus stibiiarsenatis]|uniref:Cysteine--tRNA ligase n=1 Tax=Desulfuribacillus stibiiarsenatis TaxID=1390249 RepID=A0A1E5L819_9FIRM|nr:cysteine--tRNA ligase [Desulfuribacillus stibiiarsenatis]OEH86307.1 cysteine--tRNA ligase [Desulfuribacillus stibiiarsenatis]
MTIKLYNTLSRKKEELKTVEPGKVKMYVCGPTVYNYIHIGNARAFTMFDVVRSYLEYRGYDVTYIQNFTDVDDKLINRAQEEGTTVDEVATKYIDAYYADADAMGVKRADVHPRVTDHIQEIIEFVQGLIEKGFAYVTQGDVYFDTQAYHQYGKLSQQDLDELQSGARVEVDVRKKNPLDFALWKSIKPGEIFWESPWGKGRPGWHIECSAMVKKYLGETIDIHAGGQDLVFPHHENEVAQSEALNGKPFANYWIHNGYINIENKKMSKSLGNVMTVHELRKLHSPEILRFFLLSAHYRSPINFSEELLEQAANGLDRLRTTYQNLSHRLDTSMDIGIDIESTVKQLEGMKEKFEASMDDDFNTSEALAVVFDIARDANVYLRNETTDERILKLYLEAMESMLKVFRISVKQADTEMEADIEALIEERQTARKNKDFKRSDEIRDQLLEQGIILEDTPQGVRWKRKRS